LRRAPLRKYSCPKIFSRVRPPGSAVLAVSGESPAKFHLYERVPPFPLVAARCVVAGPLLHRCFDYSRHQLHCRRGFPFLQQLLLHILHGFIPLLRNYKFPSSELTGSHRIRRYFGRGNYLFATLHIDSYTKLMSILFCALSAVPFTMVCRRAWRLSRWHTSTS
jgi:hypothetical protein